MARTMKHQTSLLLARLGRHEPHAWPRDRFANRLRVGDVVLLPLDVGLHIGRRHQPHCMPKRMQFTRPVVRRGAGLYTHQTWRQLLEECQDVPAPQLTAHNHLARGVNAVYLKYRLGDLEAGCRNRLHRYLLQNVGASNGAHILGTLVLGEEPSTASEADNDLLPRRPDIG